MPLIVRVAIRSLGKEANICPTAHCSVWSVGCRAQEAPRQPAGILHLPQCVGSSEAAALAPTDLELSASGPLGGTECEEEGGGGPGSLWVWWQEQHGACVQEAEP